MSAQAREVQPQFAFRRRGQRLRDAPERRRHQVDRAAIGLFGRGEIALLLQHHAEIGFRLREIGTQRQGAAIGLFGAIGMTAVLERQP